MRFVKTKEEIRRIQGVFARCHFLGARSLSILFETTPETVRALLPPPLEPAPGALATGWVGDIGNSNCVGPFLGAALYVRARYQDIAGNYCVTMPMSTPEAITFGREVYGEPKKLATIVFETQDDYVWGSAERRGIRFLSLRGRMTAEGGTGRVLCEVDPDAFMPYVFSKMDDFSEIAEGGVLQAQASRKTREGRGQWRAPK